MPFFRDLSYTTDIEESDQVAIWKTSTGQPMRGAVSALVSLASAVATEPLITRASISATPEIISLSESSNHWVIITQTSGTDGTVTINLPGSPVDGQEVMVSYRPRTSSGDPTILSLDTSPLVASLIASAEFIKFGGVVGDGNSPLYRCSVNFRYDETDDLWYEF